MSWQTYSDWLTLHDVTFCCKDSNPNFPCFRLSTFLPPRSSLTWTLCPPPATLLSLSLWTPESPVSMSHCPRTRSHGWIRGSECLRSGGVLSPVPIAVPYWNSSLMLPNRNMLLCPISFGRFRECFQKCMFSLSEVLLVCFCKLSTFPL